MIVRDSMANDQGYVDVGLASKLCKACNDPHTGVANFRRYTFDLCIKRVVAKNPDCHCNTVPSHQPPRYYRGESSKVHTMNYVVADGSSNWMEGFILICFYVIIAISFWFYPGSNLASDLDVCP